MGSMLPSITSSRREAPENVYKIPAAGSSRMVTAKNGQLIAIVSLGQHHRNAQHYMACVQTGNASARGRIAKSKKRYPPSGGQMLTKSVHLPLYGNMKTKSAQVNAYKPI